MSQITTYFPAHGKTEGEIEIESVKPAPIENTWVGHALLPGAEIKRKVVIYQATLPNGETDLRAVPARCPHQGYDISYDDLKEDGNVYCTLHKRPICVYSEFNQAFTVKREAERWFIPKSN